MKYFKKIQCFFIILALLLAIIPFQAHAAETFEIVGWYEESCHNAVVSVKVDGVELSAFDPFMYHSVPDISTVTAQASESLNIEITLEDGYVLKSVSGGTVFLSGVQSNTDHITGSSNTTSIQLPSAEWLEEDEELYLAFTTERKPESGGLITVENVELNVEKLDCQTLVKGDDDPAPEVSVPSGKGYRIVPDSVCWVKKEGINYIDTDVFPFVAEGTDIAVFKVDITDRGSYLFSENLNEEGITINNGTLLDFEMITLGGPEPEATAHVLCLTVCMDLNHDLDETWIKDRVEPTCTEDGHYYEEGLCSLCGAQTGSLKTIPALGHKWGEWTVTKKATETEEGEETRICSVCGEKETRTIPKNPNTGDDQNARLWIALAGGAVLSALLVIAAGRKYRKKQR